MACFCLIDAAYYLECVKNLITTASIMRESYATRLTLMQRSRKKHSLREKFSLIGSQKEYNDTSKLDYLDVLLDLTLLCLLLIFYHLKGFQVF